MNDRSLVLVVGPGRSGTSTLAGSLAHTGFHVPRALPSKDANPLGFFEPRWVVNFHKRRLREMRVATLDPDPEAPEFVQEALDGSSAVEEISEKLDEWFSDHDRLVIKDPRAVWFADQWAEAASEVGVEPGYVMMLRHPSEVSLSRETYYSANPAVAVAGWTNVALLAERVTRGSPRVAVHYPDLLEDWRSELSTVAESLDIPLDPAPEVSPHPVDEFIDPSLRRMSPGWDGLEVPDRLIDLSERTFSALREIADEGEKPAASAEADALSDEYADLFGTAQALTYTTTRRRMVRARATGAARARARLLAEIEQRSLLSRIRAGLGRLTGRRERRAPTDTPSS